MATPPRGVCHIYCIMSFYLCAPIYQPSVNMQTFEGSSILRSVDACPPSAWSQAGPPIIVYQNTSFDTPNSWRARRRRLIELDGLNYWPFDTPVEVNHNSTTVVSTEANCPVTGSDIETNPARTDRILVSHYAADRDGVAFVMVGHQGNFVRCLGTRFDLTQCAFVGRPPHRYVVD